MKGFYLNNLEKVTKPLKSYKERKILKCSIEEILKRNVNNFDLKAKIVKETYY